MLAMALTTHAATYVITGSGTSFTATKDGSTAVSSNKPIQDVINAIQTNAAGSPCTIQFGSGGDNVLDIGTKWISFRRYFNDFTDPNWGLITLTGKITSSYSNPTISFSGNLVEGTYYEFTASIESTADIANSGGDALSNGGAGSITINGGVVSATNGAAVRNTSIGAVIISGGTVSANSGTASNGAIVNKSTGTITISGGTVLGTGDKTSAIENDGTGKITVSGNAKVTSANTDNIATIKSKGDIEITGGTVENTATKGAIYTNPDEGVVTISGGKVLAKDGRAVYRSLTLTGGVAFAYGTSINDVLYIGGPSFAPSGDGLILAWNKAAGKTEYTANTNEDIFILPVTATAVWLNKDGKAGIDYANGANTGFIAIEDVTVSAETPILLPQIANGNIQVRAIGNAIVLENLPKAAKIEVYNLQGKRIYSSNSVNSQILRNKDNRHLVEHSAVDGSTSLVILVQTKGMYIVKIGSQTTQTIVR